MNNYVPSHCGFHFPLVACLFGWILTAAILGADHYVAQNGQTPSGTFTSWETAASNIQDALNAAYTNSTVWIGAGRYTSSTSSVNYAGTNVVYIDRALTLSSSNGATGSVIIDGQGSNRGIAVVYSGSTTNLFVISGLIISNCSASVTSSLTDVRCYGGGIMFKPAVNSTWTGVVQNCIICDNSAGPGSVYDAGGGIYGGYTTSGRYFLLITNSTLRGNRNLTGRGGAYFAYLASTANALITRCLIETNWSQSHGGGIYSSGPLLVECCVMRSNVTATGSSLGAAMYQLYGVAALRNCLIYNNGNQSALCANNGSLEIYSCTIVNNYGLGARVDASGKLYVFNTISYSNSGGNLSLAGGSGSFTNTCSYPSNTTFILTGTGNITNNPQFVDFAGQDFKLSTASPCINSGLNQAWMEYAGDFENHSRIDRFSGRVDMGCYEYLPRGTMFKVR